MRLLPKLFGDRRSAAEVAELERAKNSLSIEVTDLVNRREAARREAEDEAASIRASLAELRMSAGVEADKLRGEVEVLSARRDELGKPLSVREDAVTARERAAIERESVILAAKDALDADASSIAARLMEANDRASECDRREADIIRRETGLKASEDVNRWSASDLSAKWSDFHRERAEHHAELRRRESDLSLREKVILEDRKWLDGRNADLSEARRKLHSDKAAFEAAKTQ